MGRAVGIDVKAQQFVIKASKHIAGTSRGFAKGKVDYELLLQSIGVKVNANNKAKYALKSAVNARRKHYKEALEKGVFKRVASVKSQFGLK